ncbi:MAG: hypothetical protein JXP34_03645 [Planctomycetes bacterium]|nr:hypothetical protein [Planctomycetota bacterium]
MKQILAVLLTVTMCGLAFGAAGPADYAARLVPATAEAAAGAQVTVTAEFDFKNYDVQGFSIGICTVDDTVAKAVAATEAGTDTAVAKGGAKPDFLKVNVLAGGVTVGVVVDFFAEVKIPPTDGFTAVKVTYDVLGDPEACTDITICDTLGSPPVQTVVVVEGVSIKPEAIENGTVCVKAPAGTEVALALTPADGSLLTDQTDAEDVAVEATNQGDEAVALQGWSYGVAHDAAKLTLVEIKGGPAAEATNGGEGPDFYALDTAADPGPGGTVGCVISLEPPFEDIPLGVGETITLETFVYVSAEVACIEAPEECPADGGSTALAFSDGLGSPAVDNVLVVEGLSVDPVAMDGTDLSLTIPCCGPPKVKYVRGDANADRKIDIADGVWTLNELFLADRYPTNRSKCLDATDANADGQIDASDAIYIFYYQLLDGPEPPAPFPVCAEIDAVLGCEEYPCQ